MTHDGATVFHLAAINGVNTKITEMLLQRHSYIESKDNKGNTAFHYAARYNIIGSFTLLLEKGADINTVNNRGQTALHVATYKSNANIFNTLLEKDSS